MIEATDDKARLSDMLDKIIPDDSNNPYDMKDIINEIVDHGNFLKFLNIGQRISLLDLQD